MNPKKPHPTPLAKTKKIRLAAYLASKSSAPSHAVAFKKRYEEYVANHPEYEPVDFYWDEGEKRLELSKRKEWARLLRDCENGKVDRVITASVAGLTRNYKDLLEAIYTLKEMGVGMYFEQEDLDTDKIEIGSMQEITEMLLKESGSKAMGMTQAY